MMLEPVQALEDAIHRQVVDAGRASHRVVGAGEIARLVRLAAPLMPGADVDALVERVLARTGGLGALEPLLADPATTEVMVNGPGPVWIERHGRLLRTDVVLDEAMIDLLLLRIVSPLGLRVDRSSPMIDARLPDGSRVNAVVPPLAVDGPCLTIRRFGVTAVPLDAIAGRPVAALLRWAITAGSNVVVCGGTGAGKTTLLNALAAFIDPGQRIVTVEDAAELRLPGDHVVRLEARPASTEGTGQVTIRDLVRNALRMRPDRLIVGEARGAEALDLLQAMNTGHDGSLSTCHANGPDDALRRLETMVLTGSADLPLLAVREQLASAVDFVVHIARTADGGRRVRQVAEVCAEHGDGATRTRLLVEGERVVSLPTRGMRSPSALRPSGDWLAA
jgi:pilus assembly protein CpaF